MIDVWQSPKQDSARVSTFSYFGFNEFETVRTISAKENHVWYKIFFVSSELVSEMVRVLPKSTN